MQEVNEFLLAEGLPRGVLLVGVFMEQAVMSFAGEAKFLAGIAHGVEIDFESTSISGGGKGNR